MTAPTHPAPSGCLGVRECVLLKAYLKLSAAQNGEGKGLQPLALKAVSPSLEVQTVVFHDQQLTMEDPHRVAHFAQATEHHAHR